MKKLIITLLVVLGFTLSACTEEQENQDVRFNIQDGAVLTQYEGQRTVDLSQVYAYDYLGKEITVFIEVRGTYDLDTPGEYNISLYVADDIGNNKEISVTLVIEEITCEIDNTQDKCIIHVDSIDFTDESKAITGLYMEGFTKVEATVLPIDATDATFVYTSSDKTIASVNEYGYVFGHTPGTVTITATTNDGDFEATLTLEVWEKTCDDDPLQDKCADAILGDTSRIVTIADSNVSGTDYNDVYPQNALYYQIYVRTFANSDNDFKGDFNGLKDNLPYLSDLGVRGLWLMPINQSRSDHGYEVDDYYDVDNEYGTMAEFEALLAEAETYDIDIIIDLVINHMGAHNPIFQDVLKNGVNSDYYDWFSWLDASDERTSWGGSWGQTIWYNPTNRSWLKASSFSVHPSLSDKYFCAYFSDWMPDLNLENPEVRTYLQDVATFWLNKGVDGFRMDATSHFYGTNEHFGLDNHHENVAFLTEYQNHILSVNPNAWVVVEAWEGYGTYAAYTEAGVSTINFESNYKIKEAVNGTYSGFAYKINNIYNEYNKYNTNFIDAPFISHHDGLGRIEKHVDEEQELRQAAEILLTLQGNPIIYYGDELGMAHGANNYNESRNNMVWGDYYSGLNPSSYDYNTDSVSEQLLDEESLLRTYQELGNLRDSSLALKFGDFVPFQQGNLQGYYRIFENGEDKELVVVLFNFTNTLFLPVPDEFTSYEILYRSNDTNFGGISPNSTMILELPWDLYTTLID